MTELEELKMRETILAFSYWENWSYFKSMAQCLGGTNLQVRQIEIGVNQIREEWNAVSQRIKEIEDDKHNIMGTNMD